MVCPKCGYVRRATDAGPDWQCAACGIAVEKYRALVEEAQVTGIAQAVPVQHEARLSLGRRVAAATPELSMALLFIWCWIAPNAWRPTLYSDLALIMAMELFAVHSGMFFAFASPSAGTGARLVAGVLILAFYLPVAGAFAYFYNSMAPWVGFAWLLLGRVISLLVGQGSTAFESKRQMFHWGNSMVYYIGFAILFCIILPMPSCGLRAVTITSDTMRWGGSLQDVLAFGTFYFGAMGITRLLEKPEWIEHTELA